MQGKQYPGIKGKVVHWADHAFEEGILYVRIRFTDNTELCWRIRQFLGRHFSLGHD